MDTTSGLHAALPRPGLPPMPPAITRLPLDRGLPVIYVSEMVGEPTTIGRDPNLPGWACEINTDEAGNAERRSRFGEINKERQRRCMLEGRCGVCGGVLGPKRFFVCEQFPERTAVVREPWLHATCLRWALQVCPALLTGRVGDELWVFAAPAHIDWHLECLTVTGTQAHTIRAVPVTVPRRDRPRPATVVGTVVALIPARGIQPISPEEFLR